MEGVVLSGGSSFFDKVFEDSLKERKIVINTEVSQDLIEQVVLQILKFNKEDKDLPIGKRTPIYLYINSLGGDVFSGLSVVSCIKNSKTPIIGITLAYAYSMGAILFAACHKRYMFEYSSLLIHDGNTSMSGSAGKVKDLQKFYDLVDKKLKDVVINNSHITSEEYDNNLDRELYLFADECKTKGLCDGIIGVDIDLDEIL